MEEGRYTRSSPVCYMDEDIYPTEDQRLGQDITEGNGESVSGSSYAGSDASSASEPVPGDRGKSTMVQDPVSSSRALEGTRHDGTTTNKSASSGSATVRLIVEPENSTANSNQGSRVPCSGSNESDLSGLGLGQVASHEASGNLGSAVDGDTSVRESLIDLRSTPGERQNQRHGPRSGDPGPASRELEAEMSGENDGSHGFTTSGYPSVTTEADVSEDDRGEPGSTTWDVDEDRVSSANTPQIPSNLVDSVSNSGSSASREHSDSASDLHASRDVREIVLPRWQPDAEVTYCPICRTQFSFFVRKHHCRRCGRVVCNACSPHRITIPYQFIVQPPLAGPAPSVAPTPTISSRASEISSENTDRNGGMKVRLCNPCVPDPNPLPPQTQYNEEGRPVATHYLNSGNRPYSFHEEITGSSARARGLSAASGLRSTGRSANTSSLLPFPNPQSSRFPGQIPRSDPMRMQGSSNRTSYSSSPGTPNHLRGHSNRHQSLSFLPTGPSSNPQPHYRSLLDIGNEQVLRPPPTSTERPLPPVPRINEEDECPVCHRALPSRGLPDFEARRASHIVQCIDEQISIHNGTGSRPGAYTSQSQPAQTANDTAANSHPHTTSTLPTLTSHDPPPTLIPNTPAARTAARERAHAAIVLGHARHNSTSTSTSASSSNLAGPSYRTGMFLYRASEKDCVDDAECTICLEEFEVGAPMARLECFCRFHRKCIQDWFVDHPGRCPVHQHDGYGF